MSTRAPKHEPQPEPEDDFYPTRWWRAIDEHGDLLAETSNPRDFDMLGLTGRNGVTIQRLYEKVEGAWREDTPPKQ